MVHIQETVQAYQAVLAEVVVINMQMAAAAHRLLAAQQLVTDFQADEAEPRGPVLAVAVLAELELEPAACCDIKILEKVI